LLTFPANPSDTLAAARLQALMAKAKELNDEIAKTILEDQLETNNALIESKLSDLQTALRNNGNTNGFIF
jgi:hypothetical protein